MATKKTRANINVKKANRMNRQERGIPSVGPPNLKQRGIANALSNASNRSATATARLKALLANARSPKPITTTGGVRFGRADSARLRANEAGGVNRRNEGPRALSAISRRRLQIASMTSPSKKANLPSEGPRRGGKTMARRKK